MPAVFFFLSAKKKKKKKNRNVFVFSLTQLTALFQDIEGFEEVIILGFV